MHHLPQFEILPGMVERLYALPLVQAVYLGGSLGRGGGDIYSDLDLQVAVHPACTDFLPDADIAHVAGAPPLATVRFPLGAQVWMHHLLLSSGIVVDLQCRHRIPEPERRQLTWLDSQCTQLTSPQGRQPKTWAPTEIAVDAVGEIVQTFWVTLHKHRRGLTRGQDMVIWAGLHHSMAQLMRLQFIAATGQDCGDLTRMGIYGLSGVHDWLKTQGQTPLLTEILQLGSIANWTACVSRLAVKSSAICQILRTQWNLPARLGALERMVTAEWQRALRTAEE